MDYLMLGNVKWPRGVAHRGFWTDGSPEISQQNDIAGRVASGEEHVLPVD
jgi:hypothetical protein